MRIVSEKRSSTVEERGKSIEAGEEGGLGREGGREGGSEREVGGEREREGGRERGKRHTSMCISRRGLESRLPRDRRQERAAASAGGERK